MFSVDILMNKRYNAPVILFKNFNIFFMSVNFEPRIFENLCYASKIRGSKLTDLKKCKSFFNKITGALYLLFINISTLKISLNSVNFLIFGIFFFWRGDIRWWNLGPLSLI